MEFLWLTLGVLVGSLVTNIIYLAKRISGILEIDHSDPEKDMYRFIIDDLEKIDKKSRIVLLIKNRNFSQK